MSLIYISLILFSTSFITGLIFLFIHPKTNNAIKLLLAFSGAFLLAICILHLIPELYENYNFNIGVFILLGFILQLLLDVFSKGIEHGHFHIHQKEKHIFPYTIFLSLCLHSFVEGMALIQNNNALVNSLLVGIVIHKIPIVIVLSALMISQNVAKKMILIAAFIFSISAPLGLVISKYISLNIANSENYLIAIAVGIFIHISTTILFESSDNHSFDFKKFITIIIGLLTAMLTL